MATGDSKTCTYGWMDRIPKTSLAQILNPPVFTPPPKKKKTPRCFFHGTLNFVWFFQVFSWDLSVFHGTCPFCSSCCLFVGHFEFNSLPPLAFLEIKFDLFSQEGGSKNRSYISSLYGNQLRSADREGPAHFCHILVSSLASVTTLIT